MPIMPPVTTAVRPLKSSWFKLSLPEAPQIIMAVLRTGPGEHE
jgi:hypothetical protein